jgi:hypothetical protein
MLEREEHQVRSDINLEDQSMKTWKDCFIEERRF